MVDHGRSIWINHQKKLVIYHHGEHLVCCSRHHRYVYSLILHGCQPATEPATNWLGRNCCSRPWSTVTASGDGDAIKGHWPQLAIGYLFARRILNRNCLNTMPHCLERVGQLQREQRGGENCLILSLHLFIWFDYVLLLFLICNYSCSTFKSLPRLSTEGKKIASQNRELEPIYDTMLELTRCVEGDLGTAQRFSNFKGHALRAKNPPTCKDFHAAGPGTHDACHQRCSIPWIPKTTLSDFMICSI